MRTDIVFVTWTHATTLDSLGAGDGVVQVLQPLSSGGTARPDFRSCVILVGMKRPVTWANAGVIVLV